MREYAYGPAQALPDSKVGTFTQALYDEAKKDGWVIISVKKDWNRIFGFDGSSVKSEISDRRRRCRPIERPDGILLIFRALNPA